MNQQLLSSLLKSFQTLSNFVVSDIASLGEEGFSIDGKRLASLISMFIENKVSSRGAKDIILKMTKSKKEPLAIAEESGLLQKSDEGELTKVAEKIISDNEAVVSEYKNGKISALQFLVGQGMKATSGSANPQVLRAIFEKLLN